MTSPAVLLDPLQAQAADNRRRVTILLAAIAGGLFVVVWLVLAVVGLPLAGLVVAALVAGCTVALLVSRSDAHAVARLGAAPADPTAHARFHNVVEGLCVAAGLPKPSLLVVEDEALNALALGREPRTASLVVTSGLLDELTRIELEGVLAHELTHVKSADTLLSTIAIGTVGRVAPGFVDKVVGGSRETLADVTGVSLTRYPPGLISALEKLRDDPSVLRSSDRAIAHLWIEPPIAEPPSPRSNRSRPPLEERIQALREL